jgi:hypothetical protein
VRLYTLGQYPLKNNNGNNREGVRGMKKIGSYFSEKIDFSKYQALADMDKKAIIPMTSLNKASGKQLGSHLYYQKGKPELRAGERELSVKAVISYVLDSRIDADDVLRALNTYASNPSRFEIRAYKSRKTSAKPPKKKYKKHVVPKKKKPVKKKYVVQKPRLEVPENMSAFIHGIPGYDKEIAEVMYEALDRRNRTPEDYRDSIEKKIKDASGGDKRKAVLLRHAAQEAGNTASKILEPGFIRLDELMRELKRYINR